MLKSNKHTERKHHNEIKEVKPKKEVVNPVEDDTITFLTIRPNMRVGKYRFRNYFLTLPVEEAQKIKNTSSYGVDFWTESELEDIVIDGDDSRFPPAVAKELRKYFLAKRKHVKDTKE